MFRLSGFRTAITGAACSSLIFLLPAASRAQIPALVVTDATIAIDPAATDNYDLQGSITGLSLSGASSVTLAVGNFQASVPVTNFVQQPGTNLFIYQDATGQTPYWISSLTLDLDGQTFEMQASGVVLAGLTNPFAVQLGTDQASACTMVRVQQQSPGTYQLTPGDPSGMTCELSNVPLPQPYAMPAGAPTSITFSASAMALGNGAPQNPQLFRADDNAQPVGDPLCALSLQQDGTWGCSVTFNESAAGTIPLLISATVNGQTVFAPGFSLQVLLPPTDADVQQLQAIQSVMLQAVQNFAQYGDSAYPRIMTLMALRQLLAPPVGLTGQPVGLCPDGLNIGVRPPGGMPVTFMLNDTFDTAATPPTSFIAFGRQPWTRKASSLKYKPPMPEAAQPRQASQQCGLPKNDVVWNNKVLLWDPGASFFESADPGPFIETVLARSLCPLFDVSTAVTGAAATPDSLRQFTNFGTIIMSTHGGTDLNGFLNFETGAPAAGNSSDYQQELMSGVGVACNAKFLGFLWPTDCYQDVTIYSPDIVPLTRNTILYMGFCHGHEWLSQRNPTWGLNGNVAFFDFLNEVEVGDDINVGLSVFGDLANNYQTTKVAFAGAPSPAPPAQLYLDGDSNLAYLGNPKITSSSKSGQFRPKPRTSSISNIQQFSLNMLDPALSLEAQLDGADSCQLNYQWTNTATAGHLSGGGSGSQEEDDFSSTSPDSSYTPMNPPTKVSLGYSGDDSLTVNFVPDPANPPAAQACGNVAVIVPLLVSELQAAAYDASNPETVPPPTDYFPGIPIGTGGYTASDPGTFKSFGATANVAVSSKGTNTWTVTVTVGGSNPTPASGAGPYQGMARLNLLAVNPPSGQGKTHITINGQLTNSTPSGSFPDGEVYLTDSQGNYSSFSLYPGDMGTPFTASLDSTASATNPVSIYIGINANTPVSTPASYTATLNVQFLSQ